VGTGLKTLAEGTNTYYVYALSEMGIKGATYTLKIIRTPADNDTTLSSLTVRVGSASGQVLELAPAFSPDTKDYIIYLFDEEEDDITVTNGVWIDAVATSAFANVGGKGYKVLKAKTDGYYHNIFEIVVQAQNGDTDTYTISFYRNVELSDDTTIEELTLIGSDGVIYLGSNSDKQTFDCTKYEYEVTVPYNVESVTLAVTTLRAGVIGAGTKSFGAGYQEVFRAKLIAESGNSETDYYIITVNREIPIADDALTSITINDVPIADFDPEQLHYRYNIPFNSETQVTLEAELASDTARMEGDIGTFEIPGKEFVKTITVIAQNGQTRTYSIAFTHYSTEARLKFLNLEGFVNEEDSEDDAIPYAISFSPETQDYTVLIDKSIKTIILKPEVFDKRASVKGLIRYPVGEEGVTAQITVLAEDNETQNTYTVNVVKSTALSSDNSLKLLDVDGYSLEFSPGQYYYTLNVKSSTDALDVIALANEPNAKVSILGNEQIEVGKNIVTVKVEAENGNSAIYQIQVSREAEADYLMAALLITAFLLWLLAAIILFIRYKKKDPDKIDAKETLQDHLLIYADELE